MFINYRFACSFYEGQICVFVFFDFLDRSVFLHHPHQQQQQQHSQRQVFTQSNRFITNSSLHSDTVTAGAAVDRLATAAAYRGTQAASGKVLMGGNTGSAASAGAACGPISLTAVASKMKPGFQQMSGQSSVMSGLMPYGMSAAPASGSFDARYLNERELENSQLSIIPTLSAAEKLEQESVEDLQAFLDLVRFNK